MEFLDEESRPRFLFQSRPSPSSPSQSETQIPNHLHKPTLFISLSLSSFLFILSIFYIQSDPLKSIILWFSISLLVGPFAPSSLTAGDIRVGLGELLEPPHPPSEEPDPIDTTKKSSNRRPRAKKIEDSGFNPIPIVVNEVVKPEKVSEKAVVEERETEWSEGDLELLKKQMVKYPVGMPGRWEAVASAFFGRHKVESVVKMAKSTGDKRVSDSDSFSRFLKDRKPVDKRIDDGVLEMGTESGELSKKESVEWSAAEDLALLNALKAFPKDVGMRWEKISAAVPGKSKAVCMKRVADLKKDFRSSKA